MADGGEKRTGLGAQIPHELIADELETRLFFNPDSDGSTTYISDVIEHYTEADADLASTLTALSALLHPSEYGVGSPDAAGRAFFYGAVLGVDILARIAEKQDYLSSVIWERWINIFEHRNLGISPVLTQGYAEKVRLRAKDPANNNIQLAAYAEVLDRVKREMFNGESDDEEAFIHGLRYMMTTGIRILDDLRIAREIDDLEQELFGYDTMGRLQQLEARFVRICNELDIDPEEISNDDSIRVSNLLYDYFVSLNLVGNIEIVGPSMVMFVNSDEIATADAEVQLLPEDSTITGEVFGFVVGQVIQDDSYITQHQEEGLSLRTGIQLALKNVAVTLDGEMLPAEDELRVLVGCAVPKTRYRSLSPNN